MEKENVQEVDIIDMKRMTKEFLKFGDVEIKNRIFLFWECSNDLINGCKYRKNWYPMVLPMVKKTKKTDAKYSIGYKTCKKIRPLYIELSQMTKFFYKFGKRTACTL